MEAALDALKVIGAFWLPILTTYGGIMVILGIGVAVRRSSSKIVSHETDGNRGLTKTR